MSFYFSLCPAPPPASLPRPLSVSVFLYSLGLTTFSVSHLPTALAALIRGTPHWSHLPARGLFKTRPRPRPRARACARARSSFRAGRALPSPWPSPSGSAGYTLLSRALVTAGSAPGHQRDGAGRTEGRGAAAQPALPGWSPRSPAAGDSRRDRRAGQAARAAARAELPGPLKRKRCRSPGSELVPGSFTEEGAGDTGLGVLENGYSSVLVE